MSVGLDKVTLLAERIEAAHRLDAAPNTWRILLDVVERPSIDGAGQDWFHPSVNAFKSHFQSFSMSRQAHPIFGEVSPRFLQQIEALRLEEETYDLGDRTVLCYILSTDFNPRMPIFAGSVDSTWLYLSEAIPRAFRYPVVVHETTEYEQWAESRFDGNSWEDAHKAALLQEFSAAKELGILDEYAFFRLHAQGRPPSGEMEIRLAKYIQDILSDLRH